MTTSWNERGSFCTKCVRSAVLLFILFVAFMPSVHALAGDTIADYVFGEVNFTTSTGGASATLMRQVYANVAFDSAGRLYIGEYSNSRVIRHDNPLVDTVADAVYGQPDFTTTSVGTSSTKMNLAMGVAFDSAGRMYVADYGNKRVLRFDNPLVSATASAVYGQPNFTSNTPATTRTGLGNGSGGPVGILIDPAGRLYICDYVNNRVVRHDNPLADTIADAVFGQPNFTSSAAATTQTGLSQPFNLAMDTGGRLYIGSFSGGSNRVVRHDNPLVDTVADAVFGQPNFTSSAAATTQTGLNGPGGVALDTRGRLYIADFNNNRVVRHDNPLADTVADFVIGQPNFISAAGAISSTGFRNPTGVAVDSVGRLYVTEATNQRVVAFDDPGAVIANNVPAISPAVPAQTRTEDTAVWTIALTAFGSDSDAADVQKLFWTVTGGGTKVTASMNDSRTLRVAPILNANGTETVTLRLSDN